jgi:dsDNA-specific endonuclease/ATPase MutS2
MTDQQKYEEAAKAHFDAIGRPDDGNEMRAWIAGAEHASKEAQATIQFWKGQLEKVTAQRDQSNKFTTEALHENQQLKLAKEEAHNEAIDKALTVMKIEWREDRHEIYNAIEKLKL